MSNFHYEWWTVRAKELTGWITYECKGKNKESVIKQIKRAYAESNSKENLEKPILFQKPRIVEVDWDSLTLDRIGYQRRF